MIYFYKSKFEFDVANFISTVLYGMSFVSSLRKSLLSQDYKYIFLYWMLKFL